MNDIWTLAEHHKGEIKQVSYELLTRGRILADAMQVKLASVVISSGIQEAALQQLIERGADEVYVVSDPSLSDFVCETYSSILVSLVKNYSPNTMLSAATSTGRTVMPHLAIKLGTGLTADCTDLSIDPATGNLLQTRPAIGGNIMATIKTPDHRPQMATVRPKSAQPLPRDVHRKGTIIHIPLAPENIEKRVKVTGYTYNTDDMHPLEEADCVVAGGRGLKKGEHFALIRELAEQLDGAVGASRDAVDRGWISYSHQVGLSGKSISPKLYLAAGISGSVQHLAGIKTAETIVAVNIDPHAAIHQIADFSIVGDLFSVIPILTSRLKNQKKEARI